jgi:uncharacterized membrane protein YjfL (UPF0719 family)
MEPDLINMKSVVSALVFTGIGLAIFIGGFVLLNLLMPKNHIWREINEEKNVAIAIFLGSIIIGTAMIISSAIRG